jgi:S1-C subfamily serine protease
MNTKTQTGIAKAKTVRPKAFWYHVAIFLGATGVLLAGGIWRGGRHPEVPQDSGVSALDALRQEVSGLQSVLRRNELQSIQDGMTEVTRTVARSIVAIMPRGAVEPVRAIKRYGLSPERPEPIPAPSVSPGMSGLLVDQEGHIVTSASVTRFGPEFQVVVEGVEYAAELKSVNAASYIALLKLLEVPPGLPLVRFDGAPILKAGEWLIRQGRSPTGTETRSAVMLEAVRITSAGQVIGLTNGESAPELDGAALIDIAGRYWKPRRQ